MGISLIKRVARMAAMVNRDFNLNGDIEKAKMFSRCVNQFTNSPELPKVICLCGSTKFKGQFIQMNFELTMRGYIVLTVGWFSHFDKDAFFPNPEEKLQLDELHKRKIDLADEVLVINVDGYIGESTRSEINYAASLGKKVIYLENVNA